MSERDYTIGYGKPPEWGRFKKGQSGNPKGRPRKAENTATIIKGVMDEEVTIKRHGEPVGQMSRRRGIITIMANKAMGGDVRAAKFFFPNGSETQSANAELVELTRKVEELGLEQERIFRAMTPIERRDYRRILVDATERAELTAAEKKKSPSEG